MSVLNRVYDTVAVGFVHWKTVQADSGGANYPGPGTFGVDTSDYVVASETSDLTDQADEIAAAATGGSPNSLTAGTVKTQLDENLGHGNDHINDVAGAHAATAISAAATAGSPNSLALGTAKSQLDELLGDINNHENASPAHAAADVSYAGSGAWADASTISSTDVEGAIDEVVSDLAATSGAPKIGAAATASSPNSLAAGDVKSQLDEVLGHINDHENGSGAHLASNLTYQVGPAWLGGRTNPPTNMQSQIDKIINDLGVTTSSDDGSERIGAQSSGNLSVGSVRSQLDELDAEKAGLSLGNNFILRQKVVGNSNTNPTVATSPVINSVYALNIVDAWVKVFGSTSVDDSFGNNGTPTLSTNDTVFTFFHSADSTYEQVIVPNGGGTGATGGVFCTTHTYAVNGVRVRGFRWNGTAIIETPMTGDWGLVRLARITG